MSTASATNPSAANLDGDVLDNLQAGLPLRAQISAMLNAALKARLADAADAAKLPALVDLIDAMPADLVAAKDLTLRAFAQQQIDPMVAANPRLSGSC